MGMTFNDMKHKLGYLKINYSPNFLIYFLF